jgi:hypothetical protein
MASNTNRGYRQGSVKSRSQFQTPKGHYAKRDSKTGQIIDVKTSSHKPFKGVTKEQNDRRSR